MLNKCLEYIWKNTHCASVAIKLFHWQDASGKFVVDESMKALLKERKFKWKRISNGDSGRFEVQEVLNSDFMDQMRQSKAQIYRKGLAREDVLKEPLTIYFSSMVAFGPTHKDNKAESLREF